MNFNIPSHVSPKSLLRAKRLGDCAKKMDLYPGKPRWGEAGKRGRGNYIFFLFTNKYGHLVAIFCSPHCYLMQYHTDDDNGVIHTEYSMIRNIRHQLFKLKRKGFTDCEHIKRFPI